MQAILLVRQMALELPQPALDNCLKVGADPLAAVLFYLFAALSSVLWQPSIFQKQQQEPTTRRLRPLLCRAPAFVRLRAEGRAPAAAQRHAAPCAWLGVPYIPSSSNLLLRRLPLPAFSRAVVWPFTARTHLLQAPLAHASLAHAQLLPACPPLPLHQGVYRAFSSNAKFVNAASLPQINFMGAAVIEMYGINPSEYHSGN